MHSRLIDSLKNEYKDKKVLVMGLGLQGGGLGAVQFFLELGADVTITDLKSADQLSSSLKLLEGKNVKTILGQHHEQDFIQSDLIIKSPKVRWDNPLILSALAKGVQVDMESSFFAKYCPARIIGITGTRGKSTTTYMIYDLLKKAGKDVVLGGNIPHISTISLLKDIHPDQLVVLELSSWQLSGFKRRAISPHIAVFSNFYPDHLDYYSNMDEYYEDKAVIYQYQKPNDYAVINKSLQNYVEKYPTASHLQFFSDSDISWNLKIQGTHNVQNASSAYKVGRILGIDEKICKDVLEQFAGVPYRQQIVRIINNVTFVNDTTSTTPVATNIAIEAFKDKYLVLIFGGSTKHLPTEGLLEKLKLAQKIVLLKGSFTNEVMPYLQEHYAEKISKVFDSIDEAVVESYRLAKNIEGPTSVVLSPGATSFEMFKNEFHRGDEFNRVVNVLK
ncbi:MAG: UDP-N-acetylmuramoyl-L-alanine--D-glutamate ligase [Candidatus Roizmanbacteria bacterium]